MLLRFSDLDHCILAKVVGITVCHDKRQLTRPCISSFKLVV
jgi:hypothetical protein